MVQTSNPSYTLRVVRVEDECWQVRAMTTDVVVASVKMRIMSECLCIGIVFHLETLPDFRRQGIAYAMLNKLEDVARSQNISLLLLTVRTDNLACRALCHKVGFVEACAWQNPHSGNDLILGRKVLKEAQ